MGITVLYLCLPPQILHCKLDKLLATVINHSAYSPLFDLQSLSMPLRCNAMRDSSLKLSRILKSHNGLTSKNAMWFFAAYVSASRAPT